jgi:hypothetical protein
MKQSILKELAQAVGKYLAELWIKENEGAVNAKSKARPKKPVAASHANVRAETESADEP